MTYKQRILQLTEAHQMLDRKIAQIEKENPYNKDESLAEMKKKKLALKDEISRLTRLEWEEQHETVDLDDDR